MITLQEVVYIFMYLLGAGLIFGILWGVVYFCQKKFPNVPPMFFTGAQIFLVIAGALVLIGIILHAMGAPLINWRVR